MRIPEIEWISTSAKQKRSSQSTKHSRNQQQWLGGRMRLRDAHCQSAVSIGSKASTSRLYTKNTQKAITIAKQDRVQD